MGSDEVAVRSSKRGGRVVVAHKAASFEDADRWDLEYWLQRTPAVRIEALEQIRLEWGALSRARNK